MDVVSNTGSYGVIVMGIFTGLPPIDRLLLITKVRGAGGPLTDP